MTAKLPASVGRPARISREDIADAALRIGLKTATLKEIAAALGVDHSSLYRHVKNRGDIVFAAADRAIATLDWEQRAGDWRSYVRTAAESVWDLYARNPGLAEAMRSLEQTPPSAIRAFSRACRQLESHGFGGVDAALIMDSVMDMTSDSASLLERLREESDSGGTVANRLSASWQAGADAHTALHVSLMTSIIEGDPKDWWGRKLTLILHGAEVLLKRQ